MKKFRQKAGYVLPLALILLGVSALAMGAVTKYVTHAARMTRIYRGRTECRLAAQSALEAAKGEIYTEFLKYVHTEEGRVGLLSTRNSAFTRWFSPVADRQVGTVTLPESTNVCGCVVKVRALESAGGQKRSAVFALVATAWLLGEDGNVSDLVSATVKETLRYGVGRSRVFDHAYFVNNYGWFQGSGCTANGDVRANGNMYLDTSAVINGNVYAARNEELGVLGNIENYGKMQTRSQYWSSCGTSARPTSPTSTGGPSWAGGYEAPDSTSTSILRNRLYGNLEEGITMPFISDLEPYIDYATEEGGTVKQGNATLINAHYSGVGPSGDATYADKGAIILTGTRNNPIVVDGPVVVDSDVIISGYVTGQGTIYSGRNIHIVGNITYVNPPSWPHPDSNPQATAERNASADLLGLMAKGNIVLGDCTSASWHSKVDSYLKTKPYVQEYICDASDESIGYPRTELGETLFCGDYTQLDGGEKVAYETVELSTGHNGWIYTTDRYGRQTRTWGWIPDTATVVNGNSKTRHYYDSVIRDDVLSGLCSTVTHVDAVLYNNHGIFGNIGECTFNGSLVCRNEGLIYSSKLYINWDIRLASGSAEGADNAAGLALDASEPCTLAWEDVPITENPAVSEDGDD